MAKLETFSEAFASGSAPSGWTPFTAGSATLSYAASGAQVNFPATTSSSTDGDTTYNTAGDLTNSYAYAQILSVPATSSSTDCTFYLKVDANNSIQWQWEAGSIYAEYMSAGSQTNVGNLAYNATTHKWWRIREGTGAGAGGTAGHLYWDTSPNGVTWTQRFTVVTPITITSMKPQFAGTCFGADTSNGPFKWNNFNTTGGAAFIPRLPFIVRQAVNRASTY